MLTESEINQWFAYHTNHDDGARLVCDQAIAAVKYKDQIEKLEQGLLIIQDEMLILKNNMAEIFGTPPQC